MNKQNYKVGDKYGMLTITEIFKKPIGKQGRTPFFVKCRCDCGGQTETLITKLRSGHTKSCGCLWEKAMTKHGLCYTREYRIYNGAKDRCLNKNNIRWKDYGGRGIKFEWKSVMDFCKDMGKSPKGTSLDRINNNGNYCKENCRWATPKQQQNNSRFNKRIEYNGEIRTIPEWAEIMKIPYGTLATRINRGWNIEKALLK